MIFWMLLLTLFNLSSFGQIIHIKKEDSGVFSVPCKINSVPMTFIFDTGCNDVTISSLEAKFLIKHGFLDTADITSKKVYMSANGSLDTCISIIIRRLEIDGVVIENIEGSIMSNSRAPLLLGQTALERLGILIIDFKNGTIKIKK